MKPHRPRQSASQWAEVMEKFEHSGLSIQAFCEKNDIAKATFGKWRLRLRDNKGKLSSPSAGFHQVEPANTPVGSTPTSTEPSSEVTLQLGAGLTLTIRTNERLA